MKTQVQIAAGALIVGAGLLLAQGGVAQPTSGGVSPPGKICVQKYNDLDGDGMRDANEPTLAGWKFLMQGPGIIGTNVTTGSSGIWCNGAAMPGHYKFIETMQSGWISTDPGGSTPAKATYLPPGQTVIVQFGNKKTPQPGEICVEKYNDVNGNGQRDPGEGPLAGWSFKVSGGSGSQTGVTNASGKWCTPTPLQPGTYSVVETLTPGWINTSPGGSTPTRTVTVASNQTVVAKFGNRQSQQPGQICVMKYHDLNGDGVRSPNEPGLAGWMFTRIGGGMPNQSGATAATGFVCFGANTGTYQIKETMKPGWTSTDPGGTSPTKTVTVGSGGNVMVLFGNKTQ